MAEWWAALASVERVFYLIAISSTLVLVIQLFLNLIGLAGHDVDTGLSAPPELPADFGVEHADLQAHSTGMALISVRTITAFFVGLGWGGVAMLGTGAPLPLTLIVAVGIGIVFLFVVFYLMKGLFGLSESGNIDVRNAVGQTGTVYIPIPGRGKGSGQIQVVIQGRLREVAAIAESDEGLPAGASVEVVRLMGASTMVVRKLEVR